MSETDTGKAVQVLDLLLEFFGASGTHWTRGRYHDGHGQRCLIGALDYLRRKHRIPSERAEYFLHEGMPHRRFALVYFNDHRCGSFAKLRSIIVKARDLAATQKESAPLRRWSPGYWRSWKWTGRRAWQRATTAWRHLMSAHPRSVLPPNPAALHFVSARAK